MRGLKLIRDKFYIFWAMVMMGLVIIRCGCVFFLLKIKILMTIREDTWSLWVLIEHQVLHSWCMLGEIQEDYIDVLGIEVENEVPILEKHVKGTPLKLLSLNLGWPIIYSSNECAKWFTILLECNVIWAQEVVFILTRGDKFFDEDHVFDLKFTKSKQFGLAWRYDSKASMLWWVDKDV